MDQSNRGDRVLMVVVDPFLKGGIEPRRMGLLSGIADVIYEDIDAVESRFSPLNNSTRSILAIAPALSDIRNAAQAAADHGRKPTGTRYGSVARSLGDASY